MMPLEFPIWVQVICYAIWIVFLLFIIRGIYRNGLKTIFNKRRCVPAQLISKVSEPYRELKVYANTPGSGITSPTSGFRTSNMGTAYRLYFKVDGKDIELDVDRETYEALPEEGEGMLEYKGNLFYSFDVK